jgi:uncharacterized membrane protein
MLLLRSAIRIIAAIGSVVLAAGPALALEAVPTVPAPIAGAGIPALLAIAGGYWALRRGRKR